MRNLLDLADQGIFLSEQASGATAMLQCAWVYNRSIDFDGLRRFHHHLQRGRLCRSIERSPLPFGRDRWITPECFSDIEIVASVRPREEFDAWLTEQAKTPLDAERGPGWHLAVQPFTDGGTGLSLVISHCLADGLGLTEALVDAACGRENAASWPTARSRRRSQALREDFRQTLVDIPGIGRAVAAAARLARHGRRQEPLAATHANRAPARPSEPDERLTLPKATIFLDADEWDARAHSLGGTSNALLAGLATHLAQRMGRVAGDGSLTLAMPVNERIAGDTRANAVTNVDIIVQAVPATTDLREIRTTIKQALIRHAEVSDERWALLPFVPLTPKWLARRMIGVAAGGPTTVVATNLGDINPAAIRPDGTDADDFAMMSLFPGVSKAIAHRAGGRLALGSGSINGRVFLSVLCYQPGHQNSNGALQQDLSRVLTDFSLTAVGAGWGCRGLVGGDR